MAYLMWQIEPRTMLKDQIEHAAAAFRLRTGTPATTLVIHEADRARIDEIGAIPQRVLESTAGTGMVRPGMFWIGTPS